MKDVNAIISKVLATPEEFPDCIVVVCKSISDGIKARKESAVKQRGTGEFAHENFGPRGAYLYFFGREAESTLDVENFIVRFYSEYNNRVGMAF